MERGSGTQACGRACCPDALLTAGCQQPSTKAQFHEHDGAHEKKREYVGDNNRPGADEYAVDGPEGDTCGYGARGCQRNIVSLALAGKLDDLRNPAERRDERGTRAYGFDPVKQGGGSDKRHCRYGRFASRWKAGSAAGPMKQNVFAGIFSPARRDRLGLCNRASVWLSCFVSGGVQPIPFEGKDLSHRDDRQDAECPAKAPMCQN